MNDQEVFDKVVAHLRQQVVMSRTVTVQDGTTFKGACMYRGPNGLMCAIGCLIPDNEYIPKIEGKDISTLLIQNFCPDSIKEMDKELLKTLQSIHDACPTMGNLEVCLDSISKDLGLQFVPGDFNDTRER